MWRRVAWGVLVVALAACTDPGGGAGRTSATGADGAPTSTSAPTTTASSETAPSTAIDPGATELTVFLAAVDRGLEGTTYEGEPYADPESFLATGILFCRLLRDGLSVDELLTAYAAALAPAEGSAVPEEDLRLGGVVLGASIRVFCPEFSDQVMGE